MISRVCRLMFAPGLLIAGSFTALARAEDTVEFVDGKTLSGKVIEIRMEDKEFEFAAQIGTRTISRTYPYSQVHAVTFNGKRFVLTPKRTTSGQSGTRSTAEVNALIEQVGASPPDWLESTAMTHPASLDLNWPLKANGPWNESKNVGQYLWGRVSPNTGRWRSGIKLLYHCMDLHKGNRALLNRDMEKLGEMYFVWFQDYPRAAYWLREGRAPVTRSTGVYLAECYWRLGNKSMALGTLRGNRLHLDAIKLFGDMGEVDQALELTQMYARSNLFNEAFINAGDALRSAGKLDEAISYYQRVLTINKARNKEYLDRFRARASGAIEAIRLYEKTDISQVREGTYRDSSVGYNGSLDVEVVVANAKIESVKVTQHKEKQFYAALTDTPRQIIENQSIRNIDGTSGATITSQAIVHATARAIAQGAN